MKIGKAFHPLHRSVDLRHARFEPSAITFAAAAVIQIGLTSV